MVDSIPPKPTTTPSGILVTVWRENVDIFDSFHKVFLQCPPYATVLWFIFIYISLVSELVFPQFLWITCWLTYYLSICPWTMFADWQFFSCLHIDSGQIYWLDNTFNSAYSCPLSISKQSISTQPYRSQLSLILSSRKRIDLKNKFYRCNTCTIVHLLTSKQSINLLTGYQ